jgi:hypothetical protein
MKLNKFELSKIKNGLNVIIFDKNENLLKEIEYHYQSIPMKTSINYYDNPIVHDNGKINMIDGLIILKNNKSDYSNKYGSILFINKVHWKTIVVINSNFYLNSITNYSDLPSIIFVSKTYGYLNEIYQNYYSSIIPSYKEFKDLLNNYDYLVIDNLIRQTSNWKNSVFYYNTCSFPYNYPKIKEIKFQLNKEIIEYYYHPSRIELWIWELDENDSV